MTDCSPVASGDPQPATLALRLAVQPLHAERFAAYGSVIGADGLAAVGINGGTSQRCDVPGLLSLHTEGGHPVLAVFRARAQHPGGPWHRMERHCLGSQTFIPLRGARCIVLVALGYQAPDLDRMSAFVADGRQGFTLNPGVWHHPLIAIDDGDFVVLERCAGVAHPPDCEVQPMARPVVLTGIG